MTQAFGGDGEQGVSDDIVTGIVGTENTLWCKGYNFGCWRESSL